MVEDGERLRPEACQSPVWDTGLALLALRACGISDDHPQLVRAGEYLLAEEVRVKGDWAIRRPDLAPGGWAFEYENDFYPDVDDTAVLPLALHGMGIGEEDAIRRGLDWLVGMQSRGGGWGAFDVDNQAMWLYKIPFCDFGKVTDEPSADVTAHSLEALGALGSHREAAEARGRVAPLRAGGGRLVVRPLGREPPLRHGRGAAGARGLRHPARPSVDAPGRRVARLGPAGERRLRRGHPLLRRSRVAWAGGISRRRRRRLGRYSAYVAAGNAEDSRRGRAADYLCAAQRPDGDWHEEHFTGTGFPLDFMIRYHLYRITFPLLALGRLRERLAG